jgi:hypothetical protein
MTNLLIVLIIGAFVIINNLDSPSTLGRINIGILIVLFAWEAIDFMRKKK